MPRLKQRKKPEARPGYKMVEVPDDSLTPEQRTLVMQQDELQAMDEISEILRAFPVDPRSDAMQAGIGRLNEFKSYFPGRNKLDEEGNWIIVAHPPSTEFTVPPLSMWFAEPWPQKGGWYGRPQYRVKVVTPKGSLGLYPHEYSRVDDITKYIELIDPKKGLEIKFFGGVDGIPRDALFYLRSRGIAKADAIKMLIGIIKSHGVCWIEASRTYAAMLGCEWPHDSRNATL